jgi:hypothetical protein
MLHNSHFWQDHFRHNLTKQRINWEEKPTMNFEEKKALLCSLKAWQLGETSEGQHLLAAAGKYANKINDPHYVEAVKLFIKEEQKHGANLGKYIDLLGEQRTKKDWGDTLFRKFRYFNTSMELWTITVLIVESAAQVFYEALKNGSNCKLLKEICEDILVDEAHHIKFQNERMYFIFQNKKFYNRAFSLLFYSVLFFGTIHAVWYGHRKAFIKGGVSKKEFMRQMYYKFLRSLQFLHGAHKYKDPYLQNTKALEKAMG